MIAIILAGGKGTRLRSQVFDRPKPMADINGKPFLFYLLRNLSSLGFTQIIMSIGYLGHHIVEYFGDEFLGMNIIYEHEPTPMGTGGAAKLCVQHCGEDNVFILNGDSFFQFNPQDLMNLTRNYDCNVALASCLVKETHRYGSLTLKDDLVTKFQEKSVSGKGIINTGIYYLKNNSLSSFKHNAPFSLEADFLAHEVRNQKVRATINEGYFIDIGTPEDYTRIKRDMNFIFN
jgi:D-glycero-alpha-D-manno-heptose 1-phosphate guanylyltransferase